jgi:hypothetical protein
MTITNGYATLPEFKAYVTGPGSTISTDSGDDAVIESIIEGASRYIDRETLRTFYARAAEARLQDVPDGQTLYVDDDLFSIDTGGLVNGDGTVIVAANYQLLPLNKSPKYAIRLNLSSSYAWAISSSTGASGAISVTGSWGYSATAPHDIRLACLTIAKGVYNRRFGENQSSDTITVAGGMVITPKDVPAMAAATINAYRRRL